MKAWKTFEYAILQSFEHMVNEYPDLWGAGFRRRQAFGGQGFDIVFESNLGRFLIECKTKKIVQPVTGKEKFYVEQAIREDQMTELLEYATGMGMVPLFAFGVFGPGRERQAWLIHAEDVARLLLRSRGITVQEIATYGVSLPKLRAGEPKRSIYLIDPGLLKMVAEDYREKTQSPDWAAVWEWAKEHREEIGVNLTRAMEKGGAWAR